MRYLALSLLGSFDADLDGQSIKAFGTDKARGLLAYLAVEAGRTHRRERLAGLFWPEKPDSTARKSLRQGLVMLRRALADRDADVPFLLVTRQTVQLNPAANCIVDSVLFAQLVTSSVDGPLTGDNILELERAVALYKGDFLAGFSVSGCLEFEEWVRQERERLHQQMLVALDCLTAYYEGQQEYVKTIEYAQRQIALEPWREQAHRQLICAFAKSGQRNQALVQYETCTRLLWQELAVEPDPETTALYEQIRTRRLSLPVPITSPPSVRDRHAALRGGKQQEALAEIGQEIENVHLAWQWAIEHDKSVSAIAIRNLIPHFIIEQHQQGNISGDFHAVTLFLHISGFTATTEALMQHGQEGAEILVGIMRGIFDPLMEPVYAQGGFVIAFIGDAFTALFIGSERKTYLRALAAALDIRSKMIDYVQQTPFGSFSFAIRLALADGLVEWGILRPPNVDVTSNLRAPYYFSGPAINDCVAAEGQAQIGELILSTPVYNKLNFYVRAKPVRDHFCLTALRRKLPPGEPFTIRPLSSSELAPFVPAAIRELRRPGEFRQILSLFFNLQLSTRSQLEGFTHAIFALQKKYGGYLNIIGFGDMGATMLLFWGMPTSFENDIERVLNFVLELKTISPVTFRAGITHRLMYAGFIGSSWHSEYGCYGGGVNLAARLMLRAPWNTIWLDYEVAERAQTHFDIRLAGRFTLKGFADKQPVFALIKRKEMIETFYQGQMVGREQEVAQLNHFIQPLFEARFAGLLLIRGEAGIGKSRLVHTIKISLMHNNQLGQQASLCKWALCQSEQTGSMAPSLHPFRYFLRRYFAQRSHNEAKNKQQFDQILNTLIQHLKTLLPVSSQPLQEELERSRSFLGALIDLQWAGSLYEQLSPKLRFKNTIQALKTLFKAESLRQPLIIYLEDVHWIDSDSLQFIEELTRQIDNYPIAIIATTRPKPHTALFAKRFASKTIDLHHLSSAELAQLGASLLGRQWAEPVEKLLATRAEGNPFFAEQILLYLQEEALLTKIQQGHAVSELLLPSDVRTLLVARIDRLTQEVKEVVQTAAILGREFEVDLLAQMLREEGIERQVSAAEKAAIWYAITQLRYIFKHALLRDAAYDMQLRARQRELHQLAGEAIETLYATDLTSHYGQLAYHYGEADNLPQERHYARLAAEQAAAHYANNEATRYFSRALELTLETALSTRYDLLLARERVYGLQGEQEAQAQDLATLTTIALTQQDKEKQATVSLRQAEYARIMGDYAASLAAIEQAIAHAKQADVQGVAIEAAANHIWGTMLRRQGKYKDAQQRLKDALRLARHTHQQQIEADSLLQLGNLSHYLGHSTPAQSYYQKASHIYQAINNHKGQAGALMSLAMVHTRLGEYVTGQHYYAKALRLCHMIGYRMGESLILGNLGNNHCYLGEYKKACEYQQQAFAISQEIGDREGESFAFCNLVLLYYHMAEYEMAKEVGQDALVLHREIGDRRNEAYTLTYLAHTLADLDQPQAAKEAYQSAIEIRRELGEESLMMDNLAGLARIALKENQSQQALSIVEQILTSINLNGHTGIEYPLQVYLTCYQVLSQSESTHVRAQPILTTAYTLLQEQATKIKDDALREHFLQHVPFNQEIMAAYGA